MQTSICKSPNTTGLGDLRQCNGLLQPARRGREPASRRRRSHSLQPPRRQLHRLGLYAWNATTANILLVSSEVAITGVDSFGVYFDVTVTQPRALPQANSGSSSTTATTARSKIPVPTNICRSRNITGLGYLRQYHGLHHAARRSPSPPATLAFTITARMAITPAGAVHLECFHRQLQLVLKARCRKPVRTATAFTSTFRQPRGRHTGGQLGFIINNCAAGRIKDPGPNQYLQSLSTTKHGSSPAMQPSSQPNRRRAKSPAQDSLHYKAFWIDRNTVAIPASGYRR